MLQRSLAWLVLLMTVGLLLPLAAQETAEPSAADQANAFFQAQEWEKAAETYDAIVTSEPGNARAWLRLGLARHNLKQYDKAIAAFLQAEQNAFAPPFTRYNLACAYARLNHKDKAFEWLAKAVAAGFGAAQQLESDDDLALLRDDPRFQPLVQQTKINAAPCEHLDIYTQFDFWVGKWDVTGPGGQQAGTNIIEKVTGGCILLENWTSARGGFTGRSINFYDPVRKQWVQDWVDSSGDTIITAGEFKDGAMQLSGEHRHRDGHVELYRGKWIPLPDGRVRQLLEQSRDEGKTWYVWFDGYYKRTE